MAITTLLDPALLPARTMDEASFNAAMAYLMANLPIWGSQTNALQANLNSIAAGGAFALPYVWKSVTTSNGGTGGGIMSFGKSSAPSGGSDATFVLIDTISGGQSVSSLLLESATSTSATKGYLRVFKVGDASKWIVFSYTAYTPQSAYYGLLSVTPVAYSSPTPFANNDTVMAQFQRTGDKGDTGYTLPSIYVRYEVPSGTASDIVSGGVWPTRTLNTVKWNDLSGSSLASSQVTLPAGTYEIEASAPGYKLGGHKIRLYNVTDSAVVEVGTNAYADNASSGMSRSFLRCRVTIAAAKAFRIEHFSGATSSTPAANGAIEVYSELKATKVA